MGAVGVALERENVVRTADGCMPLTSLRKIRRATMDELTECRIVADVLGGASKREDYIAYLMNVFYYARYSPVIMAAAGSRCSHSHPELALYLFRHAAEEHGHDSWALNDLSKLGIERDALDQNRPVPACAALVGYVHSLATSENPIATFGWMYVLEAVGADLGSIAGQKLKDAHRAEMTPTQFVAGHGAADANHIDEIESKIDRYLIDAKDREDACAAARVVSHLYIMMFRQIGGERAQWASP